VIDRDLGADELAEGPRKSRGESARRGVATAPSPVEVELPASARSSESSEVEVARTPQQLVAETVVPRRGYRW